MASRKDKLPFDELKVGFNKYKVIGISEKDACRREIHGEFHYKDCEIDYDLSLSDPDRVNTILHELGHAIVHVFGIKFRDSDQEEDVTSSFPSIVQQLKGLTPKDFVIDGELSFMSNTIGTDIATFIENKNKESDKDVRYNIFDILYLG